jgi:NAD(P)H dehydrogenase (quinone)
MTELHNAQPALPFRHLVVLANPAPEGFDHAIVDAYREVVESHHQDVLVRDL